MRISAQALLLFTLVAPLALTGCGTDEGGENGSHAGATGVRAPQDLGAQGETDDVQIIRCDNVSSGGPFYAVNLRLDERSGQSAEGFSLATQSMAPSGEADLTVSSFDCGARGRWVNLHGNGVKFCSIGPDVPTADLPKTAGDACSWTPALDIGGSNPAVAVGDTFLIARDDAVIARAVLAGRTDTPFEWYQAEDLGFDVHLNLEMLTP